MKVFMCIMKDIALLRRDEKGESMGVGMLNERHMKRTEKAKMAGPF